MKDREKLEEIERLLKEIKASEVESAVTVEEVKGRPSVRRRRFFKNPLTSLVRKPTMIALFLLIILIIALPIAAIYYIKNASTFTEEKAAVIERVQNLSELATAEAFTKVIIERQDNTLLGKEIGVNLPGTKRQVLVVVPGSIKAGVQLGRVTEQDVVFNEEEKTATIMIPHAEFLGGAELYFDEVELFSYEGLFRMKANIEEAYDLANEAKMLILTEAKDQGVLTTAEENAKKTLSEMFSLVGYEVTIQFKE